MLPGFEEITYDLTEYELNVLLPVFIKGFQKKIGFHNRITNKEIVKNLKAKEYKINDARTRKIINHIRTNNLIPGLVAGGKGYYITSDPVEIKKYIASLDGREKAIAKVKGAMKEYLKKISNGNQTHLNL